jgi:uncharacterized membrane protein
MEQQPYSREMVDEKFQRVIDAIQNIKDGQDKFHGEVKAEFADLKTNFANRLTTVEEKVEKLETVRNISIGVIFLVGVCSSLILYIYFQEQQIQNNTIADIVETQKQILMQK